ncbi:hypothetical protein [Pelotomaculum propionicicum]|uniref:Type 4 fimbrial biogenesis protein PilX N-terminal domain-containing protein n=1 Tax=Pelotomaculum propionicicum TaxID=258475 RepID=A0A4Y7RKP9_9FIRM|nr:hypothetical protein [Pelotomaculum propionicicum]TEB09578.1 hypothetical protein Pmgp_03009 [Pelotomaculum propionicicum]
MMYFAGSGKKNGQSSVIVLLTVALLFLFGSAALKLSINTRKTAAYELNQAKAYYIAEAGVEKVLAESKNGPAWLKNLTPGRDYDFLTNNLAGNRSYEDGFFDKISLKKTSENSGVTVLEIEAWGKYLGSIKKLKVDVNLTDVYAENYLRGMWLKNGNAPSGHVINSTGGMYFSEGDAVFMPGSDVTGNIYCRGKLTLASDEGNITSINGDIFTLGGLEFTGSALPLIEGQVYVDSAGQAPPEISDRTVILSTAELFAIIPGCSDYPDLLSAGRLNWYRHNAAYDQLPAGDGSSMDFTGGIYYLEGDQVLSGAYSGNAVIVVNGSVTLGSMTKNSDNDCLAILAAGTVSTDTMGQEIDAIIVTGANIDFDYGATLRGCILAPELAGQCSQLTLVYDESMCDRFKELLNWATCFIKVTKWSE